VGHVQTDVPQGIENFLNQILGLIWHLLFKEEEHIHVRVETLLFPAVAAQGDDRIGILLHPHLRPDGATGKAFTKIIVQDLRVPL
jgi:hypothetical protein